MKPQKAYVPMFLEDMWKISSRRNGKKFEFVVWTAKEFEPVLGYKEIAVCETKDSAAFIVRAVNSHEELLAELKDARDELIRLAYTKTHPALDRINRAIAKTEGK